MLQQTGVKTVQSYFLSFIKRWPNVIELNKAKEDDVLKAWSGLGYYRRARNLKNCAKTICEKYNGIFPLLKFVLLIILLFPVLTSWQVILSYLRIFQKQ